MRRLDLGARPDWRERAAAAGFSFHTFDAEPYWDETHAYAFTLDQIEREIEAPSAELHALCLAFAARAVRDEAILASLGIPDHAFGVVRESWERGDPSLYGRLDLAYDGTTSAKLLEYNADTPTALYETGVFQWLWLEDMLAHGLLPPGTDQFNAVHERLIARFAQIGGPVAFTCMPNAPEDRGTVAYLQDCAHQAGLATRFVPLDAVSLRADGAFSDGLGEAFRTLFKLYPWEWAFRDAFGRRLAGTPTRFLEPPWKAVLSTKGLLPHLWAMAPGHPNLLPAYFEDDPAKAALGASFVRKPILSREGANVLMVRDGAVIAREEGPYGAEGAVRQALAELPVFAGERVLVGSWIVGDEPAGLCLRESAALITGNQARFVPHVIVP
ncbi:glutathionylspermidine synthase family protein [Methylobacterium nodulans]|uniref:Glutathionylspermidine synthase n=1 Tax=Methylobacterium nodulans (strain LMG 21967 / CNCM I-2342 / ORS 2060) TaxID=460265 RepID=B8IP89_METNO|nr:glutathionylspermidine synthase family protein [Methylobacterium nodulans]ACL60407.1 glutathionylspermidine synthase [Methylobacterium nodulans ORS 2060]